MNTKCLITILVDASGSMLGNHKNATISKLDLVNGELGAFFSSLKKDSAINSKIQICVVKITEKAELTGIIDLNNFEYNNIATNKGVNEDIGLGVLCGIQQIEKWEKRNFYNKFLKQNYIPYLLLITDLNKEQLAEQNNNNPFKQNVLDLLQKEKIKFFAIGLGDADIESMFPNDQQYSYVSNSPSFEDVLQKIKNDLSQSLVIDRPLKEEIALLSKYVQKIKNYLPYLKKHFKKIGVALLSFALFPISFSLFEINGINIEIAKIEMVAGEEIKEYKHNYPNNEISVNIENKPSGVYLNKQNIYCTFSFEQKISNHNLGEYSPYASVEMQKAFDILLGKLINISNEFNVNGDIFIKITGESDANRITENILLYKGEMDNLKDKIFYNSETNKFNKITIMKNSYINNNTQLAFLRGYSLWDLLRRKVDLLISQKTDYQQVVILNKKNKGGEYRTTKFELIIQDIELKKQ